MHCPSRSPCALAGACAARAFPADPGLPQVLSYRHGFHAGNHADVLKHVALVVLLRLMTRKDKPLAVVDTHAGAGMYSLEQGLRGEERRIPQRHRHALGAQGPAPPVADYVNWSAP